MPVSIKAEQDRFTWKLQDDKPAAPVTFSVYRIVCFATGEVYVGCTVNPTIRRISHFRDLRSGEHINKNLQRAYDQWGEAAFYFEVIERNISPHEAIRREQYWIDHFDSRTRGFNVMAASGNTDVRMGVACTWNSVEYPSIAAAARANHLDPSAMWHRVNSGWTRDEDMPVDPRSISCTWNGVEYPSVGQAARSLKMPASTLRKYLKEGKSGDQDIQPTRRPCVWNGIAYRSVGEAARSIGMPKATLRLYLSKGYTGDADRFTSVQSRKVA